MADDATQQARSALLALQSIERSAAHVAADAAGLLGGLQEGLQSVRNNARAAASQPIFCAGSCGSPVSPVRAALDLLRRVHGRVSRYRGAHA
jgi:hypothetical protein